MNGFHSLRPQMMTVIGFFAASWTKFVKNIYIYAIFVSPNKFIEKLYSNIYLMILVF